MYKQLLLVHDSKLNEKYIEGFLDSVKTTDEFISSLLKKYPLSSMDNAMFVINNIILYLYYQKQFYTKGE